MGDGSATPSSNQGIAQTPSAWWTLLRRCLPLLVGAWVLALVVIGTWATYYADHRQDQYQLLQLGQCVRGGGRMYADAWENKPPGLAWINALGLTISGGAQWGAWLLPGATAIIGLSLFGLATSRVLRPVVGAVATCLASVVLALRVYDTPSINPDFYASTFGLGAFSLWLLAVVNDRAGLRNLQAVAAGVLWAGAAATKQTGAVGLVAITVVSLLFAVAPRGTRRRGLVPIASAWVGFLFGIGLVVLVLYRRETLAMAWDAIYHFNRPLAESDRWWATLGHGARLMASLAPLQLPLLLAAIGAVATCVGGEITRLSPAIVCGLVVWWLTQTVLASMGPSGSMRYWQATFPPMLFLAAIGLYHLEDAFEQLRGGHRTAVAVAGLALLVTLGQPLGEHFAFGVAESQVAASRERTERDELKAIGDVIKEVAPEGEPIYVFAYDAGVYVYADRPAACRFNYPRSTEQMEEILFDVTSAAALLLPESTAPTFGRWCDNECQVYVELVLRHYQKYGTAGKYTVWTRRPVSPSHPDNNANAARPVSNGRC